MLTAADKWLIGILIVLAVSGVGLNIGLTGDSEHKEAIISVGGEVYETIPLKAGYRREIRIGGDRNYDIIEAVDGRIRVREADCPDQDCVKMGWISSPPQQIVCLPYRIVIRVVSETPGRVDAITR